MSIDCNRHSLLISEDKGANYVSRPNFPANSDSFWVYWLFMCGAGILCTNSKILLVYILVKIKMSFIQKVLFCQNGNFLQVDHRSQLLNQLKFV